MDLCKTLKETPCVKKLFNQINLKNGPLDFLFFICPRMKDPGIVLEHGKLTARYVPGLSGFTENRISRVNKFASAFGKKGVEFRLKAVFASADSFLLFSPPVSPPKENPNISGILVIPNLEIYKEREVDLSRINEGRPWLKVGTRNTEEQRLKRLLPIDADRVLKQEFVERVFAGFALDGLVASDGVFGENPVILGVESPGVPMLQNAALAKPIPVIELE